MASQEHADIQPSDLPLRLGRYELTSLLGNGGMAQVFGAELMGPAGFRKRVAVKLIRARSLGSNKGHHIDFFVREARLGGLLRHPNIVDIYELGEVDGQPFIAMELVDGMTLSDFLRLERRPPPAVVLEIASGVTAGLASAHRLQSKGHPAGLIHRDIKPSNILLAENGAVKISDFGIAVTLRGELAAPHTDWRSAPGTLSYMSPEQLRGHKLDGRSDLFSLGLVLTELVSMKRLPRNLVHKRLSSTETVVGCALPDSFFEPVEARLSSLVPVLKKCLQIRREDRYESAQELLQDIETLRQHHGWFPRLHSWLMADGPPPPADTARPPTEERAAAEELPPTTIAAVSASSSTPPRRKSNLRKEFDRFIGREKELDALRARFTEGARLLTLKGTGGTGKTRLARHYAHEVTGEFYGGTWFVDLTEATRVGDIANAVAETLEIPSRNLEPDALVEKTGAALRSRGPLLMVLDNFEQAIQCADESLGIWLDAAPEARFIVTSREPTRLPGETVFPLEPLSLNEGVELFRERAATQGAKLADSASSATAIQKIVQQLDGLPLAIELAAARCSILHPEQILDRLSERFKLLRGGRRKRSDRQATLKGLIEWSWELLEPWEQRALSQLSVFRGGFFVDAAESVVDLSEWPDAPWSLDVISSLFEKSLLHRWETEGQPRFDMYLSIRDFADLHLGDARTSAQLRHATHYSALGEDSFQTSLNLRGRASKRNELLIELDNCIAGAMSPPLNDAQDTQALCAIAAATLLLERGPYSEGLALLRHVSRPGLDPNIVIRLRRTEASFLSPSGRYREALALFKESLSLAREHSNHHEEGRSLAGIATIHRLLGKYDSSLKHAQEALQVAAANGDSVLSISVHNKLGLLHHDMGNPVEALDCYNQVLGIAETVGFERLGPTLTNIGLLHQEQGRYEQAEEMMKKSAACGEQVRDRRAVSICLGNLGIIYNQQHRNSEAESHYRRALKLSREIGYKHGEGIHLGNLGDHYLKLGKIEEAEKCIAEAVEIFESMNSVGAAIFRGSMALVLAKRGELKAAQQLAEAADNALRGHLPWDHAKLLCKKAQVLHMAGDTSSAVQSLQTAQELSQSLNVLPSSELGLMLEETSRLLGSGV